MSVRNKLWKIKPNNIQIEKIKQYDPLLNQLLINRGIIDFSARKKFLDTSLFDLHDPYKLLDMDKAVNRIKNAIKQKQKILVYGDYDVDGITSTVILLKVIEELGGIAEYYIPDRHKEGYGLNKDALLWAAQSGFELIITVDCGISAVNEASFASELGLDLVITDHHEAEYTVPDAVAVINPKRIDCNYPFKYLAGVGVAFKLAQALWHFTGKSEHFLCDLLCLVALGTVADVVPLIDENRIFVKYGLELMNEQVSNLGLKKLLECAGYQGDKIDCYVLAYILAPRMNAIGRLDHANWAVKLLLEKDEQTAANLAEKLNEANRIRQKIENDILAEAEEQIIRYNWDKDKVLVIASSNWNPGVIGIVASRLMEKYYKPVIMIALEGEIGKGSGRSISKFNLYQALKNCQDLLVKFGGHSAAAGLTIEIDRIEEFRIRINHYADQVLEPEAMLPELDIDLELNSRDISFELVEKIEKLAPFGCGNPIPLFLLRNISVQKCMQMGKDKDHLKLVFSDGNLLLEGVFFKQGSFAEIIKQGDRVSVVFRLSINNWNGERKVQLLIEDLEIHSYVSPFPAINSLIRTNLPVIDMDDLSQSKGLLFLNEIQKKLVEFISKEKKPIFLSVRSNFYGTELLEKTLNIFSYWGIKIAISCPFLGGDDYIQIEDALQLGYDIIVISWEMLRKKIGDQLCPQNIGEVLELDFSGNLISSPLLPGEEIANLGEFLEESKKVIFIINSSWTSEESQKFIANFQLPVFNCVLPSLTFWEKVNLLQDFFVSDQGLLIINGFLAVDLDYSDYTGKVVVLDPCLTDFEYLLISTVNDKLNGKLYRLTDYLLKRRLKRCLRERVINTEQLRELYKILYLFLKRNYAWSSREEFAQTLAEAMENKYCSFSILLGLAVFIELGLLESMQINGKYIFKLKHEPGKKVSLEKSLVYLGIQREKDRYKNLFIG